MTELGLEARCIVSQICSCAHIWGWRLGEGLMCGLYFNRLISAQEIYDSQIGENKNNSYASWKGLVPWP